MEHCDNLAPYQFLTAFSQLISRVCHSSDEVFTVLKTIVAKVFLAYPQQAMWLMTAVSKVCSGAIFCGKSPCFRKNMTETLTLYTCS